jgi:GT2 family glycosyltransferase
VNEIVVVMPNYNGGGIISNSIKSTLGQTRKLRLVVIDDGSTDNSLENIKIQFESYINNNLLFCIENSKNLGIAKSLNFGIKYALKNFNPKYIIKQDNDLVLDPTAIDSLIGCIEKDERNGIAGGKIYILDKPNYIQHIGQRIYYFCGIPIIRSIGAKTEDKGQFNRRVNLDLIAGCLMLFRPQVFDKIGYFDEGFSKNDFEDFDLTIRAQNAGFNIVYCCNAVGYHKISFSSQNFNYNRSYSKAYSRIKMIKNNFGKKAFIFYSLAFFLYLFYDWLIRKRSFLGALRGHWQGVWSSLSIQQVNTKHRRD